MNIKRVVIYGHFTGSHSYIHSGYYKAFKYLGYKTHWIKNISELDIDLSGTLFLTESQAMSGMPVRSDCYYILHHVNNDKFIQCGCRFINLCNYLHIPLKNNDSYNYPIDKNATHGSLPLNTSEKIKEYVYYDRLNKAIYQPWATNLLPNEISLSVVEFNPNIKDINFVGSIWSENINQILPMLKDCFNRNINVNVYGWLQYDLSSNFPNLKHMSDVGNTDEESRELISKSLIYPDIRGELHKNVGYIPCRLFKNISYGCIPITNSYTAYEFFEKLITYSDNSEDFIEISSEYLNNRDIEQDKYLMNMVRENHTYVNRVKDIIEYFDILYK